MFLRTDSSFDLLSTIVNSGMSNLSWPPVSKISYRERRSCSVLKPAKDWLRIMPLGPPGEWVPAAMMSGTRDDTPGEKKKAQRSRI